MKSAKSLITVITICVTLLANALDPQVRKTLSAAWNDSPEVSSCKAAGKAPPSTGDVIA